MKIAIVTDIHEDIVSLEKAMRKIDALKVDKVYCLGDISGFSIPFNNHVKTRNASACLSLLRKTCEIIILGNHDLHVAQRLPLIDPLFNYPDNWYDLHYSDREKIAKDAIWLYDNNELNALYTDADIAFLKELPEQYSFASHDRNVLLSHYAYPNISGTAKGFYRESYEYMEHFSFMKEQHMNLSIMGHMHPAGLYYVSSGKVNEYRFRKRQLPDEPVCVIAPSITNGGEANGFLTVDLKNKELEALKI